jgi:hypothetical protein
MKKRNLDGTVGNKIELSGVIDTNYVISPGVEVTFAEGSVFQGKLIHRTQVLYNNEYIPKQFHMSISGNSLSLVISESYLPKLVTKYTEISTKTGDKIRTTTKKQLLEEAIAVAEKEAAEAEEQETTGIKVLAEQEAMAEVEIPTEQALKTELVDLETSVGLALAAQEVLSTAPVFPGPCDTLEHSEYDPISEADGLKRFSAFNNRSDLYTEQWAELFEEIRDDLVDILLKEHPHLPSTTVETEEQLFSLSEILSDESLQINYVKETSELVGASHENCSPCNIL